MSRLALISMNNSEFSSRKGRKSCSRYVVWKTTLVMELMIALPIAMHLVMATTTHLKSSSLHVVWGRTTLTMELMIALLTAMHLVMATTTHLNMVQ